MFYYTKPKADSECNHSYCSPLLETPIGQNSAMSGSSGRSYTSPPGTDEESATQGEWCCNLHNWHLLWLFGLNTILSIVTMASIILLNQYA